MRRREKEKGRERKRKREKVEERRRGKEKEREREREAEGERERGSEREAEREGERKGESEGVFERKIMIKFLHTLFVVLFSHFSSFIHGVRYLLSHIIHVVFIMISLQCRKFELQVISIIFPCQYPCVHRL